MIQPIRLGLVGLGKIVHDQHLPTIARDDRFQLSAAASPHTTLPGVANYPDLPTLLEDAEVDAVAICTPPQVRHALAAQALAAGKHVLLEKPPGASVSEVQLLAAAAARAGRTLYATWHSRQAPAVAPMADWARRRRLRRVEIVWREDVRRWHPGQEWIWRAGGLGVFDPGVNALSIATLVLPPFFVREAELTIPSNREAPIAARLGFALEGGGTMSADFDWRQTGPQTWDIRLEAEDGSRMRLGLGGAELEEDGRAVALAPEGEYASIYARFARLVGEGRSDVDVRPLQQVADAFMLGRRHAAEPFHDPAS